MPDWSYRTISRPLLFRLRPETARRLTLGMMGTLSRMPFGSLVIRTLGHMESYPILRSGAGRLISACPVGLSGALDVHGQAPLALAQIGFGFMEVGPVTIQPIRPESGIRMNVAEETIVYPHPFANDGLDATLKRLGVPRKHTLPLYARLRPMPGSSPEEALAQMKRLMENLEPHVDGFHIDGLIEEWGPARAAELFTALERHQAEDTLPPRLIYVPASCGEERLERLLHAVSPEAWDGVVIGEAMMTERGAEVGPGSRQPCLSMVGTVRAVWPPGKLLVAAGGIHEPADALDALHAGADFVMLHSGLVYAGPGLPKRINEAIAYERCCAAAAAKASPVTVSAASFWSGWGWMCLLGLGMIVGGILAWIIAATSVVLPYDTDFLGMDAAGLTQLNGRIIPFMSHDRITLAGTMISIGVFYVQLSRHGFRQGQHWARTALLASGLVGFSSFFLYLGYGYFDPIHAAAAAILLPMFVLAMRGRADHPPQAPVNLRNDKDWLRAVWGQLLFVVLGFGLAAGGLTIAFIGITHVFVPTDLAFLCATPAELEQWNRRLIPLIAHDRAGFGGALFSDAVLITAAALWGIREGERWLWRTLLVGGLPGLVAGLGVHARIGYTDFIHLLPVYAVCVLYAAGLALLYPYMHKRASSK